MANRAYLICSKTEVLACSFADELSYDPDTEVLCASSNLIPIFWLTLFRPEDMKLCVCDEISIPTLITQSELARQRLQEGEASVLQKLCAFRDEWRSFKALVTEASGPFFKLDCAEVWDLEPEEFSVRLPAGLRFWSSGKKEDWRALLALAEIQDKSLFKGYTFLADATPSTQLQGYGWVRPVPWKE